MRSLATLAILSTAFFAHDAGADDCEVAYAKSHAVFAARQATEPAAELAQCREEVAKHPKATSTVHCIATLPDKSPGPADLDTCVARFATGEEQANAWLHVIIDRAEQYRAVHHAFPVGKASQLPAWPDAKLPACCGGPDHRCAPTAAWDKAPVWKELGFRVIDASTYAYAYESNGKTFTIRAVGDADCDGKLATYTLTGAIGSDGKLALHASLPPHGTH